MEKLASKFEKGESVLYTIVPMVCQSCLNNIDLFSKMKSKYTPKLLDGILNANTAAQAIPNLDVRQSLLRTKRKAVTEVNDGLCADFMTFMQYMPDSFPANQVDEMKKMAGAAYYKDAYGENWQASATMFGMATDFMTTYTDELTAGGLPDGFADEFETKADSFADTLKVYNDYKNTSETERAAKVTANNDLYDSLQMVMSDGKHIFKNDAAMKKQFSYAALVKKVAGIGKTGYRFEVQQETSLQPITTATITLQPGNYVFDAGKKGIIMAEVPEGKYRYVVTAPSFASTEGEVMVDTGVMHRATFILAPAVVISEQA